MLQNNQGGEIFDLDMQIDFFKNTTVVIVIFNCTDVLQNRPKRSMVVSCYNWRRLGTDGHVPAVANFSVAEVGAPLHPEL
jgi:hypothetical protein